MPRKKKKTTRYFDTPPATRESNNRLYPLVVAGDKSAREEMILSNMPMVTVKVRAYLSQFPHCAHLLEDLLSQGYVGLIEAVNSMVGKTAEDPNPTGFMSVYIHHAIGELMDYESAVRVPQRTFLRKKSNGQEIRVPTKEASIGAEHVFEREAQRDPRSLTDLTDEILDGCCENEVEKQIVALRADGRSDADIAAILGIPKTTTYMMRRGIYARFLERNPETKGEV